MGYFIAFISAHCYKRLPRPKTTALKRKPIEGGPVGRCHVKLVPFVVVDVRLNVRNDFMCLVAIQTQVKQSIVAVIALEDGQLWSARHTPVKEVIGLTQC